MADIDDVLTGLGELIGDTLYPSGTGAPSVVGAPVLVQVGWPDPDSLESQLDQGSVQVTLFPDRHERNTTRYPGVREENPIPATTWTLSVSGQAVTVGGANSAPYTAQNLCVFVNGKPYVYQPLAADTADLAASALKALIAADVAGVAVAGPVVTLPAGARIGALRIGAVGSTTREVGRQERQVSIIIWAPTPTLRTSVAKAIDPILRDARRIVMPDQTICHLTYVHTLLLDSDEKEGVYRRDLIYAAEYGTTITEAAPQIVANEIDTGDAYGGPTTTSYD